MDRTLPLSSFLSGLLETGDVTVAADILQFEEEDIRTAGERLLRFHREDSLTMPFKAPGFDPDAALWGAIFIYTAVQFILLRDHDENFVVKSLEPYRGAATPEVIYSTDLTFRFLPQVFKLAGGLAPDDILVKKLREAAETWPFSSVGMIPGQTVDHETVLEHPSLRGAYIDRIIKRRDKARIADEAIAGLIREVEGGYGGELTGLV